MPRLFVALDAPPDVAETLASLRVDLGSARWTPPEQLHLTLRFLGEVTAEAVEPLTTALAAVESAALELDLEGLGVFPTQRRPRVLFARVVPDAALTTLQARIDAAVQALGHAPDEKPFHPHLTLARLKRPDARAVRQVTRAHRDLQLSFTARQFHLYQSTLTPTGAVHEVVASFELAPG